MHEHDAKPSAGRAALIIAAPVVLILVLIGQLLFSTRAFKRFDEMGLKLPGITQELRRFERDLHSDPLLFVGVVVVLLGSGVGLSCLTAFGSASNRRRWGIALAVFCAVVVLANLLCWYALLLPDIKLREGLAK